jgi:homoserine dehydrogenase
VLGIVNGTTNYILTPDDGERRELHGRPRGGPGAGLRRGRPDRRRRGAFDAAAKAAILAAAGLPHRVTAADVHREGMTEVTSADVASARAMGCVVKLLAIAELSDDGTSVGVVHTPR